VAVACDRTAWPGSKVLSGKLPTFSSTSPGVMIAIGKVSSPRGRPPRCRWRLGNFLTI
jgi:hypothetical protein